MDKLIDSLVSSNKQISEQFDYIKNINEKMSQELDNYRRGDANKEIISIALDIIKIIEYLKKEQGNEDLIQDLEDILYRHSIEKYEEESNIVNTKTQKIIGFEETDDELLINTISKHCSCGYIKENKIIKPEYVFIYKKRKEEQVNE